MKKVIKIAILFLSIILLVPFNTYAANVSKVKKNSDLNQFDVEINIKENYCLEYGSYCQLFVNVKNNGENFSGTVRLYVPSENDTSNAYEETVQIPTNNDITCEFVIPATYNLEKVYAQIIDVDGFVLSDQEQKISVNQNDLYNLIGVFSDKFGSFSYINNYRLDYMYFNYMNKVVKLDEDKLANNMFALYDYQYIIIDNFNMDRLSQNQIDSVKNWVKNGGILIICTGKSYLSTTKWASDFCDINMPYDSIEIQDNLSLTDNVENYFYENDSGAETNSIVQYSSGYIAIREMYLDNSEYLDGITDNYAPQICKVGDGSVVLLEYSLVDSGLSNWGGKSTFISALLLKSLEYNSAANLKIFNSNSLFNYFDNDYSVSEVYKVRFPHIYLYIIVILVYVILSGPVAYYFLKKKDRREYIWLSIILSAFIFTGIVVILSNNSRINSPISASITYIKTDGDTAQYTSYVAVQTPRDKSYSLQFNSRYEIAMANSYDQYNDITSYDFSNYKYILRNTENGYEMFVNNPSAFKPQDVVLYSDSVPTSIDFDIDISPTLYGFSGVVVNNTGYDLSHVAVVYNEYIYFIDDIKKNEQIEIDDEDVQRLDEFIYNNELYLEKNDVLYNEFLIKVFATSGESKGSVFSLVEDYHDDIVQNDGFQEQNYAIIAKNFYKNVNYLSDGTMVYPLDELVSSSTDEKIDIYDGEMYSNDVTLEYNIPDNVNIIKMVNTGCKYFNYSQSNVFAYNFTTGEFERIFVYSDTILGYNLTKYISDGRMILNYKYDDEEIESSSDTADGGTVVAYSNIVAMPNIVIIGGE